MVLCPTEKQAFVRIESFLEPVCRKREKKGLARPALVKRVSGNPAEMGNT
jgi:hypothetical protein